MKPTLYMLCGLPASGKSSIAQTLATEHNAIIHASDKLRDELYENESYQGKNNEVFSILHKRIKEDLTKGNSVIYDATNISYKRRKGFLSELKNIDYEKVCIIVASTYEDCLKRNKDRYRTVPEDVIKRMYMNWNTPYYYEGWDNIQIVYNSPRDNSWTEFLLNHDNFDQNNRHHVLSLGKHLDKTGKYIFDNFENNFNIPRNENFNRFRNCIIAGLLHDCGKPFTKTFANAKSEITEDAHYFQHHFTGSYDSLFYDTYANSLDVAILIQWHMQPYFWEKDNNEKQRLKYKKLWGDKLYEDVMLLHEADMSAH